MNKFSQLAGFWKQGIRRVAGVTILLAGALLTSGPAWAQACNVSLVSVFANGQAVLKADCGTANISQITWQQNIGTNPATTIANLNVVLTTQDIYYTTAITTGTSTYTATGNNGTVPAGKSATITTGLTGLTLAMAFSGASTGTVTSNPAGLTCTTGSCAGSFPMGSAVSLTAAPGPIGSSFSGWTGDCTGTGTCVLIMTSPRSVVATFGSVPVCTLGASPNPITTGQSSTLTATCNPAATSYNWTGGNCSSTSTTCTVAPTVTTGYTVAGVNSGGTGAVASTTLNVNPLPPSCTLAANPSSVNLGTATPVTLTASCSGSPSSFTWTTPSSGPPAPAAPTSVNTANVSFLTTTAQGTYTYSVMATNGGGNSSLASASVTVSTVPPPSCTLAPSPNSVTVGTAANVTLTATCSNSPGSYVWTPGTGSPAVSGAGNQVTAPFPASITAGTYGYSVTATGPGGTSPAATTSVTANAPATSPVSGCRVDDFQNITGYGPGIQTISTDPATGQTIIRSRINQPGDVSSIYAFRLPRSALPVSAGSTVSRFKIDGPGGYTMVVHLSSTPCDFEPENAINYNRFTDYCQMYVGGAGQARTYWTANNSNLKDVFGNPLTGATLAAVLDYNQACLLPPADSQGYIYFNTRFADHFSGGPVSPARSTCVAGVEPNAPATCSYYLFYE